MELSLYLSSLPFRPSPKPRPTRVSTATPSLPTFKSTRVAFAMRAPRRRARLTCVQGEPSSTAEPKPEKSEKAAGEEDDSSSSSPSGLENGDNNPELSSIREAIKEGKKEKEGDLPLSGVAEEIREIEWPVFGRVLGTTGVVLAVIAGSCVVLLIVNAVLPSSRIEFSPERASRTSSDRSGRAASCRFDQFSFSFVGCLQI